MTGFAISVSVIFLIIVAIGVQVLRIKRKRGYQWAKNERYARYYGHDSSSNYYGDR